MDPYTPISVLFLCTHNSARSILAEGYLNHAGRGRFVAHSAGSSPRPQGRPNPLALRTLQEAGIVTDGLRSKSWDEFRGPGAPATAHWGYEDPSAGASTRSSPCRPRRLRPTAWPRAHAA